MYRTFALAFGASPIAATIISSAAGRYTPRRYADVDGYDAARARGHDVRLLRGPDREAAQRPRRRRGDGEPRDRAGDDPPRSDRPRRGPRRPGRAGRPR